MNSIMKWLFMLLLISLCFLACFRWATFTEFASLDKYSRASWHPNGKPNTLSITVRSEQGVPVKSAKVVAINPSGTISEQTNDGGQTEVKSAEDGLLGLIINDVPVITRTGLLKPLDIGFGLDVQVTLK